MTETDDKIRYLYRYDPVRGRFGEYQITEFKKGGRFHDSACASDIKNKNKRWTCLPLHEGKAKRHSVWFFEPNREKAIELLKCFHVDGIKGKDEKILASCFSYRMELEENWRQS